MPGPRGTAAKLETQRNRELQTTTESKSYTLSSAIERAKAADEHGGSLCMVTLVPDAQICYIIPEDIRTSVSVYT